jgi:hypothetical protein
LMFQYTKGEEGLLLVQPLYQLYTRSDYSSFYRCRIIRFFQVPAEN